MTFGPVRENNEAGARDRELRLRISPRRRRRRSQHSGPTDRGSNLRIACWGLHPTTTVWGGTNEVRQTGRDRPTGGTFGSPAGGTCADAPVHAGTVMVAMGPGGTTSPLRDTADAR